LVWGGAGESPRGEAPAPTVGIGGEAGTIKNDAVCRIVILPFAIPGDEWAEREGGLTSRRVRWRISSARWQPNLGF